MPLPYEFLQELKFRNNIEEVVSSYVNLKHRGSNFTGLCPFHSEKTPSFTIYPDSGYCNMKKDNTKFEFDTSFQLEILRYLLKDKDWRFPTYFGRYL